MNGFTIGEVAEQANVHVETLRSYERRGLIEQPPRSTSNYRLYPEDAVRRVRMWPAGPSASVSARCLRW